MDWWSSFTSNYLWSNKRKRYLYLFFLFFFFCSFFFFSFSLTTSFSYVYLNILLFLTFSEVEEEKPANWLKKSISNWVPAAASSSSSSSSSSSPHSEERLKIVDQSDKPMGDSSLAVSFGTYILFLNLWRERDSFVFLIFFFFFFFLDWIHKSSKNS